MALPDDYELLPPDPGLINPDLALEAAIAPVVEEEDEGPRPFGRGWSFDFLTGQFRRRGTLPQVAYDLDHFVVWAEKTLRTARYAHPIYDDEYGMEDPYSLIGMTEDQGLYAEYEEMVRDALMVHDRVVGVENFSFYQDPMEEYVRASFQVVLDEALPLRPQTLEFTDIPLMW